MKNLQILILLLYSLSSYSQAFLGHTEATVNLREEATTESIVLKKLAPKSDLFIISLKKINGFYNVIDINSDTEGYVHASYVTVGNRVDISNESVFQPTGRSTNVTPDVKVFNNTDRSLTLKMNSTYHSFRPKETRTLSLTPGAYEFRASAPGVIPYIGSEIIQSNTDYSWQFHITIQ